MKEEALDCTMWRNRFGRGFGPVVWQITDDDDDDIMLFMLRHVILCNGNCLNLLEHSLLTYVIKECLSQ